MKNNKYAQNLNRIRKIDNSYLMRDKSKSLNLIQRNVYLEFDDENRKSRINMKNKKF